MAKQQERTRNAQGEMDIAAGQGTAKLRVVPENDSAAPEASKEAKSEPESDQRPAPQPIPDKKPIRVKFETETGAVWQEFDSSEIAMEAAEKGVHYGVIQRIPPNRVIFHAPHVVHRAIIDL